MNYFSELLKDEPNSTYYYPVVLFSLLLERYDDALATAELGIKRYPNFIQLRVLYAEVLIKRNMFERAVDILLDVIMEDRYNFYAIKLLGILYKEHGYDDIAFSYIEEASILSPEDEFLTTLLKGITSNTKTSDKNDYISSSTPKLEENYFYIDKFILESEKVISDMSKSYSSSMGSTDDDFFDGSNSNNSAGLLISENNNLVPDDLLETIYSEAGIDKADDIYSYNERIDYEDKKGEENAK